MKHSTNLGAARLLQNFRHSANVHINMPTSTISVSDAAFWHAEKWILGNPTTGKKTKKTDPSTTRPSFPEGESPTTGENIGYD